MLFLISTPRMIADDLARQESRKASKRKSTQGSDMEPSPKEQKLTHNSLPPEPAPAPPPTVAISQTNEITGLGPTCKGPMLIDASQAPSQTQTRVVADSVGSVGKQRCSDHATSLALGHDVENRGKAGQNPEFDHSFVPAAAQALAPVQAHNNEDFTPITKTIKLSYANMHPGRRPRARLLEAQKADMHRKRYEKYCTSHGFDQKLLDRNLLPDDIMMDLNFDVYRYLDTQSSKVHSYSHGQPDLGCHPLVGSSSLELTADSTELDRCRGLSIASVGTNHNLVDDCAATSLDQEGVLRETDIPDTDIPDSDTPQIDILETDTPQSDPSTLCSSLREDTTPVSLPQNSSVGPTRNKGGRPRVECRKPRARKTPKGQTRLQKNRPIKATVNVDVWENILVFCPPEFLLKARSISRTFGSILKDDSLIWEKARIKYYGPDLPEPPLGLSEPQYADLLTGSGCQTLGCTSSKTRKTYWAIQKRLCVDCFQKSFLPPRALRRVFKELETSETPQYNRIAFYYRRMDEFLPEMKFDRWDNYQWLGPTPSWGQLHRSGQYTAFPAEAYADFSSELAEFVGSEYDVEHGRFVSKEPMPGKTCPSQDAIDTWFETKRATNQSNVLKLQAVENWCESQKRLHKQAAMDVRKSRESFFKEQAELAGWDKECLQHYNSYHAAISISRPATERSWKILQPKIIAEIMAEHEASKKQAAEVEVAKKSLAEREAAKESTAEQEAAERSRTEREAAWDLLLEQEDQASNWLLMPSIC